MSCCVLVLVDQSTEDIAAAQLTNGRCADQISIDRWHRRGVSQTAVRAALVVMLDVASQDANKLSATDDQQLVQALPADRPDPAFGDRVGPRRQLLVIRKVRKLGCG